MQRFLIQDTQHRVLAVDRGHDGHAEINRAPAVAHAEAAVLRDAAFGDIQFRHHLDAGDEVGLKLPRQGGHGLLQHAVNPELHHHGVVAALDVDVTRAPLQPGKDDGIHQPDHGADVPLLHQVLERKPFPGSLLLADHVQPKFLRGLVQHPLGGFGFLQEITHLAGRGHAHHQLPVELHFQLIQPGQIGGVGHHDHQLVVVRLQRQKLVMEHRVQRDGAEQFRVRTPIPQIHKFEMITGRQLARLLEFGA